MIDLPLVFWFLDFRLFLTLTVNEVVRQREFVLKKLVQYIGVLFDLHGHGLTDFILEVLRVHPNNLKSASCSFR